MLAAGSQEQVLALEAFDAEPMAERTFRVEGYAEASAERPPERASATCRRTSGHPPLLLSAPVWSCWQRSLLVGCSGAYESPHDRSDADADRALGLG